MGRQKTKKNRKILLLIVTFLILGTTFIFFYYQGVFEHLICKYSGGKWTSIGPPQAGFMNYCYHAPADINKPCYENSECEKQCIYHGHSDEQGFLTGTCGEYSIFDCRPTIPIKTKNTRQLQGESCV